MKKLNSLTIIILGGVVACLLSCSKSVTKDDTMQAPPAASISFTAAGASYHWVENPNPYSPDCFEAVIEKGYYSNFTQYALRFSNSLSVYSIPSNAISLTIATTTLSEGTYTSTNPADLSIFDLGLHQCTLKDIYYYANRAGDYATVTITKIHNGFADGTFKAAMSIYGSSNKLEITNGLFYNVRISY